MIQGVLVVLASAGIRTLPQFWDFDPNEDQLVWPEGATMLPGKKTLVRAGYRQAKKQREEAKKASAAYAGALAYSSRVCGSLGALIR